MTEMLLRSQQQRGILGAQGRRQPTVRPQDVKASEGRQMGRD